jgi:hypothetical protein
MGIMEDSRQRREDRGPAVIKENNRAGMAIELRGR